MTYNYCHVDELVATAAATYEPTGRRQLAITVFASGRRKLARFGCTACYHQLASKLSTTTAGHASLLLRVRKRICKPSS